MDQVALLHGRYTGKQIEDTLQTEAYHVSKQITHESVARLMVAVEMYIFNCDCGDDIYKLKNEILNKRLENAK